MRHFISAFVVAFLSVVPACGVEDEVDAEGQGVISSASVQRFEPRAFHSTTPSLSRPPAQLVEYEPGVEAWAFSRNSVPIGLLLPFEDYEGCTLYGIGVRTVRLGSYESMEFLIQERDNVNGGSTNVGGAQTSAAPWAGYEITHIQLQHEIAGDTYLYVNGDDANQVFFWADVDMECS